MPWGDCTGPWWVLGKGWCWRKYWRYVVRPIPNLVEHLELTKEEQIKILEQAKADLELEIKRIEEKLKELK